MAQKRYILAIDHGTSGIKAALVTEHGEVTDFTYEPTQTRYLPDGGAEADPENWWRALIKASRRLIGKNRSRAQYISAVAVSSTFASTVAVDREGQHCMNSLTWMDSRGAPYIRDIMKGHPEVQEGYGMRKSLYWIWKTGGAPSLTGKDDIAHLLYIKYRLPKIYAKTHKFLGSKDYLNLRLTGEFAASYDSIHLFWLTDIRDINNIKYDDRLIRWAGVDREKLPDLKYSTDILGPLKPAVAKKLGLSKDVQVVVGSPDHQSAQIGSGAVRDFEGHFYIGTSSWVECIVPFKKTDMFHYIGSLPTAIPGRYQATNEQDVAGECVNFLLNNILFARNDLQTARLPRDPYSALDVILSKTKPGAGKVLFTPWLNGERAPVDNNTLRGGFHNLSLTSRSVDMIRALYEGVAFNTRWNLMYVEKFIGRTMDVINFIGGGAQSDEWCQIFADIFNRAVRRVQDPISANARGAAFIAAVGTGSISFDDIPGLIRYERVFEPNPKNRALYDELFSVFVQLYQKNRKIYRRLNRVV